MTKGLGRLLLFAVPLLLLGLGIGFGIGQCGDAGYMEAAEVRQEALRDSVEAARAETRRAQARADSLESVARVDSVFVTEIIENVRTDTAWIPAPFDTAGILAAFPHLLASRDSLAEACDTAVRSCWEVVAAKDTVITRLEFTVTRQESRAVFAERNWDAAVTRIRRMERWDWLENALYALGGGLSGFGACKIGGP